MRVRRPIIFFLSVLMTAPAGAVDLENRDRKDAEVTINRDDGSSDTIAVKAGQRLNDICSSCVILMGDESVEVKGREVATIQGGKIAARAKR
jgi:hypothetical protein